MDPYEKYEYKRIDHQGKSDSRIILRALEGQGWEWAWSLSQSDGGIIPKKVAKNCVFHVRRLIRKVITTDMIIVKPFKNRYFVMS